MVSYNGILVNFISSYSPRVCGLASFTLDIWEAILPKKDVIKNVRCHPIDKDNLRYLPPIPKSDVIRQNDTSSWDNTTNEIIARSKRKWLSDGYKSVVILQHEYGLDGNGKDNNYNLIAKKLKQEGIPTTAVLHTIRQKPDEHQKRVIQELSQNCDRLVVLSQSGIDILKKVYKVDNATYIPHGVPTVDRDISKIERKRKFGLEDRILVETPGLVSEGKGLHFGIDAYSILLHNSSKADQNKLAYVIAGPTHPEILKKNNGKDHYRKSIWDKCKSNKLNPVEFTNDTINADRKVNISENKVIFVNTRLGDNALVDLIASADVGLMPYTNPEQISSGITFYHAGIGTPCVATDNVCSQDLFSRISDGKKEVFYIDELLRRKNDSFVKEVSGVVAKIGDTKQIAQGLAYALENSEKIKTNILKKAFALNWSVVGQEYVSLFEELVKPHINGGIAQISFNKPIKNFEVPKQQ